MKDLIKYERQREKMVEKQISSIIPGENTHIEELFKRQSSNYWDLQWSAVKLLDKDDKNKPCGNNTRNRHTCTGV